MKIENDNELSIAKKALETCREILSALEGGISIDFVPGAGSEVKALLRTEIATWEEAVRVYVERKP